MDDTVGMEVTHPMRHVSSKLSQHSIAQSRRLYQQLASQRLAGCM
jgi:hypothetical protein